MRLRDNCYGEFWPVVHADPGGQAGCADVYIQDCTNAAFERKTGSDFTYRNE